MLDQARDIAAPSVWQGYSALLVKESHPREKYSHLSEMALSSVVARLDRNVPPNPNKSDRGSTFEHQPVLPHQSTPRQAAASPVVPMTSGDDLKPSQLRRSLQQRAVSSRSVRALRPTTDAQRFDLFLLGISAEHLTPPTMKATNHESKRDENVPMDLGEATNPILCWRSFARRCLQ